MGTSLKGEAAVHFSGGSDSTLVAAMLAEKYRRVHLLTYDRISFIGATDYTLDGVKRLQSIYGENRIQQRVFKIDRVHSYLCYQNYFQMLLQFKSATAAMTFSKLAMHLCSAAFAIKYNIETVADGSAHYMHMYPDQNERIALAPLKRFYQQFSIHHTSPVFNLQDSTDSILYDKGLSEHPEIRGTGWDKQVYYMEQVLFAFFHKYYTSIHGDEGYEKKLTALYENRLNLMSEILIKWQKGEDTCLREVGI